MTKCSHLALDRLALEQARLRCGLHKYEVAQAAGLCISTVSRAFTRGRAGVTAARKLAAALDLDLSVILLDARTGLSYGALPVLGEDGQ